MVSFHKPRIESEVAVILIAVPSRRLPKALIDLLSFNELGVCVTGTAAALCHNAFTHASNDVI